MQTCGARFELVELQVRALDKHRFADTGRATRDDKWAGAAEQLEHEFSQLREQRASREVLRARLDEDGERRRVEPHDDVGHELLRLLRLRRRARGLGVDEHLLFELILAVLSDSHVCGTSLARCCIGTRDASGERRLGGGGAAHSSERQRGVRLHEAALKLARNARQFGAREVPVNFISYSYIELLPAAVTHNVASLLLSAGLVECSGRAAAMVRQIYWFEPLHLFALLPNIL